MLDDDGPDDVVLTHDVIYSIRSHVNVLTHNRDAMNNHFPPVYRRRNDESIHDYLWRCVGDTYDAINPRWYGKVTQIAIRTDYSERGKYHYTIWGKPA